MHFESESNGSRQEAGPAGLWRNQPDPPGRSSLQRYMQDLPDRRLLDRGNEIALARAFSEARRDLVDLLRGLPEPWRGRILTEDLQREANPVEWPLAELRRACGRLLDLEADPQAGELAGTLASVRALREGLERSREQLITCNLALVVHMARSVRHLGVPYLDLIQEGNLGLMRAVEKYEWKLGFRFSTYAVWWIRSGLSRALEKKSRVVRLPVRQREHIARMKRIRAEFGHRHGRPPDLSELSDIMGLSEKEIGQLQIRAAEPLPMETAVDEDGRPSGPLQVLADEDAIDPLNAVLRSQMRGRLDKAMESLRPTERRVLQMRYGLLDGRACTLREIAAVFHLSRERIRQLERLGLEKLQAEHASLRELLGLKGPRRQRHVSSRTRSVTPGHGA